MILRRARGALSALWLALPLAASGSGEELPFSTLELPEPQRHFSATQECVEPEEEMRRNHMEYILHQRDETMHLGVRTRQYALEECINCHAAKDASGEWIRVEDSRHFCASCHTYAAVKIDCFQCHADVPVRETSLQNQNAGAAAQHPVAPAGRSSAATSRLLAAEDKPQ
jgi:predicted CXXCH cytochrome family protein